MNPAQWTTSQIAKTALVGMLGALPVLAPNAAKALGLTNSDLISQKADALLALGGGLWMLGSLVWALIERVRSTIQPLTLTKAGAEAKITPTSQTMQDLHDAVVQGAVITDMKATIVPPPTVTTPEKVP